MNMSEKVQYYLSNAEHGVSSRTMVSALSGLPISGDYDIPYDPDDFRRCRIVFTYFPEITFKMQVIANKFPFWQPFVDNWNELNDLYLEETRKGKSCPKLYVKMQKLVEQAREIKYRK